MPSCRRASFAQSWRAPRPRSWRSSARRQPTLPSPTTSARRRRSRESRRCPTPGGGWGVEQCAALTTSTQLHTAPHSTTQLHTVSTAPTAPYSTVQHHTAPCSTIQSASAWSCRPAGAREDTGAAGARRSVCPLAARRARVRHLLGAARGAPRHAPAPRSADTSGTIPHSLTRRCMHRSPAPRSAGTPSASAASTTCARRGRVAALCAARRWAPSRATSRPTACRPSSSASSPPRPSSRALRCSWASCVRRCAVRRASWSWGAPSRHPPATPLAA